MSVTPYDPRAVANKMLDLATALAGDTMPITPLALQKLMFFAHARYLKHSGGISIIAGSFEAWPYGPVHPAVYKAFSQFGRNPITGRAMGVNIVTGKAVSLQMPNNADLQKIMGQVLISFGNLPPSALVSLSHQPGGAWETVWKKFNRGDAITRQIPDDVTLASGCSMFVVESSKIGIESRHAEDIPPEYRTSEIRRSLTR